MSSSRIEIFRQILVTDPGNSSVLFGLAKEYEKAGMHQEMVETLNQYLASSDDEGNAYGMLGTAYGKIGNRSKAREAYERGIAAAMAHGHPSMAEEFRMTLASDYEGETK